jgi:D-3-phosphoglycerate dehydrogenase
MSHSQSVVVASVSPSDTSFHDRYRHHRHRRGEESFSGIRQPKILHPLENEGLRLLILENISQDAVTTFLGQGYHVDHHTKAFSEDELVEKIGSYHAIGIRSKTKITQRVLQAASKVCHRRSICMFSYTYPHH